ncbi:MAG: hypothetical protein GXO43_09050 [Crenarchaeota archaeon]|nr:hypothetical protein [Thermoproteota archaeon]
MSLGIDEEEVKEIYEEIKKTARIIKGGPDERGEKLLKYSSIFLMMPDPTMISTSIGVSMIITGKLLMRRKVKGLKDLLQEDLEELEKIFHDTINNLS